jgi:Fe-S-cluster containining protein
MQEVPPQVSAITPTPLLEEIRRGGPLAALFQRAAGAQSNATRNLLRQRKFADVLGKLMGDARERQQQGTNANSLTVLHECASGCTACCRASLVEVTPLEALAMASYLQETCDEAELHRLKLQLEANAMQRTQWREGTSTGAIPACAFLGEDGLCQAYAARPLVCAGVFSFSRAACQISQPGPSETNVPLDRTAKAWTLGISGGLQQALVAAGLDGNIYELHSIVLRALEVENAFDRWLKGEDIFAGCHCTDAHSAPRKAAPPKFAGTQWRLDRSHTPGSSSTDRQRFEKKKESRKREKHARKN